MELDTESSLKNPFTRIVSEYVPQLLAHITKLFN